jgi:hypothetical protein
VAFACGSLANLRDSMIQHSMLLSLKDWLLDRRTTTETQCFTQDPAYTSQDTTILKDAGFIILEDPEAFLVVDDNSLVFTVAPNVPVRQIITDICRLAIIIWDRRSLPYPWYDHIDYNIPKELWLILYSTDPLSPRVERMLRIEYLEVEMPFHPAVRDSTIYFRKAITL